MSSTKLLSLNDSETLRAYGMWCMKMDTRQIAQVLHRPEAAVYNSLSRYRCLRRTVRRKAGKNATAVGPNEEADAKRVEEAPET